MSILTSLLASPGVQEIGKLPDLIVKIEIFLATLATNLLMINFGKAASISTEIMATNGITARPKTVALLTRVRMTTVGRKLGVSQKPAPLKGLLTAAPKSSQL